MAEEEQPKRPPAGQTVQIDALSDVQLVDNEVEAATDGEAGAEGEPVGGVSLPPPLPPKKAATPAAEKKGGLPMVVQIGGAVVLMGGLGWAAAHFLLPAAPVAPPPPPPVAPAAAAAPVAEAPPVEEVRHVRLDDEFVIGAPDPDAGPPAP